MRTFKTKSFHRWAAREGLSDTALRDAIDEMIDGLVDANLGGHVYKKRVPLGSRGKSRAMRTLIAYRHGNKAFFIYGFDKNERGNISQKELRALRRLAAELLGYREQSLKKALKTKELSEVMSNG
jgi:hypothetical protein